MKSNKRNKRNKRLGVVPFLAATVLSIPAAQAQDMLGLEYPDDINLIGLGVASVPDYYGSDKNEGAVAPIARYHFAGSRYVQLLGPELSLNLVDSKGFRAGPLIRARARRDDDVDDDVVSRMRPVATAPEFGAFVAYHVPLEAGRPLHKMVFSADVVGNTNGVYDGMSGNLRANYYYPFSQGWTGGRLTVGQLGFGMFFASDDFAERYFGVTGSDVALFPERGGVPYRPSGGLLSVKIPFSVTTQFARNWLFTVGGRYERLLDDAADSPVVDDRGDANQWGVGLAISYVF